MQDSYRLYCESKNLVEESDKKRQIRAAVLYAVGSMEAFTTFIVDALELSKRASDQCCAYLRDKRIVYDPDTDEVVERIENHPLDSKLKLILRKFAWDFDFNTGIWSTFCEFKDFRDALVHPKYTEDPYSFEQYQKHFSRGFKSIIVIMDIIVRGVFNKPLRRQLLELTPD